MGRRDPVNPPNSSRKVLVDLRSPQAQQIMVKFCELWSCVQSRDRATPDGTPPLGVSRSGFSQRMAPGADRRRWSARWSQLTACWACGAALCLPR